MLVTLFLTTRPVRGRWSSWPTAGRVKLSPPNNQGIVPANAIEMVVDQSLEDGSAVKSTLMQMSRALESDPKAAYATYVKAGKVIVGRMRLPLKGRRCSSMTVWWTPLIQKKPAAFSS